MSLRPLLAALALLLAAGPLAAQDGPLPDRRLVAVKDQDFYGGDIRSIRETELSFCVEACRADASCTAFTFNSKAGACFLKNSLEKMTPYQGALSGLMVPAAEGLRARAAERAADLAVLPEGLLAAARDQAAGIGLAHPVTAASPAEVTAPPAGEVAGTNDRDALDRWGAIVAKTDSPAAWFFHGTLAQSLARRGVGDASVERARALSSTVNAYLRTDDADLRVRALGRIALLLEAQGNGRAGIPVLRLAQQIRPDAETEAALDRAISLFGFHVVEHTVESDSAEPRVCVTFSEPLATAGVDYASFVRMAGPPLPVEVEGERLCISGVKHGERQAFTLRAGLPGETGETLQKSADIEVYVRDRSPTVRFTGRAYVLPKSADAAIPVVSVNLSEVALEIYRIGDRNLLPAIQDGLFGGTLNEWSAARIAAQSGERVWKGTGTVERRVNEDVTTALPIGDAVLSFRPGVYAMTAQVPGSTDGWEERATQWFVVTDLGLSTLAGADGLHVFVRALGSAGAREGVRLRLLARNNEILGEAVTDAEGYARFEPGLIRGTGGNEPALLTADAAGEDFAFLDLREAAFDLSDRGVEGRPAPPPLDLFLSTERGAYRPGETVHATVLARDARVAAVAGLPLTAVVRRPDGVEHARLVLADAGAGGRALALPLAPGALRGTWSLRIHADPKGAALAETTFLVEDFVPEKIDFTLTLPEGAVDPAAPPELSVAARFLYGAPGAGLRMEGETAVRATRDLAGFPGFVFGLDSETFSPRFASFEGLGTTDEAGNATLPLALPELDPVTRPLAVTAHLRLAEGSGRPVERTLSRPLAPLAPLIGVKPLFEGVVEEGGLARFEVLAVGPDLARAAMPKVGWTLSRVRTSWQWYQLDGSWNYEPLTRRERIASGEVALTPDALARIEAAVTWGRYELKLAALDGSGALASTEFWAGWYEAQGTSDTPDRLEAGLDRPTYRPGDTARLRLVPRDAGKVLVRVVSDRLVAMRTVDVVPGETVVELPVTEDWAPGAYVTATLIRPMDVAGKRNPARAIGLGWAGIDPGERQIAATFETAPEAQPRAALEAVLRLDGLAPGEEAWATIAAVDVGVLNVTGFKAPDPVGHYFGQRKLGMEMRDLYGRLIDGLQGDPGQLREGGDGTLDRTASPPEKEIVAFFSGSVKAGPDGRVRASFPIPDFNGTVKLMAVAWSAKGVGRAEADILIRDPVVVSLAKPRFLAPGDRTRLLVELAHATGPAGAVQVEVTAGAGLRIPGASTLTVTLAELGRARFSIPLVAEATGTSGVTVTVTTPDGKRLVAREPVDIRRTDPAIARTTELALAPGAALSVDANLFAGIAPGTGQATLALGPIARFNAPGLLAALDSYPYGCTEQVTSRAMPLLYLDEVAGAMGLGTRDRLGDRIAEAVAAVLGNQTAAGSFGLWRPEDGDLWLDSYVTDFLSRARSLGHAVPDRAFRSALDNLRNRVSYAQDFEKGGEEIAYALMVLARENAASVGDLRYYADIKATAFATGLARAQLGLALAYYGDQPRADAMFRLAAESLDPATAEDKVWRVDYGSRARDAAAVLTLAVEARTRAIDLEALARLAAPRGLAPRSRSTQENMWSLLAAHALIEEARSGSVLVDGTPLAGPLVRLVGDDAARAAPVTVTNAGDHPLDVIVTAFGVPTEPEPAAGDGYRIERAYFTLAGEPVALDTVTQSARLVAVLTVTPERTGEARLMVDDPLPAGFEIDNPNLLKAGDIAALDWLDVPEVARHTEFRADRFLAAVDWAEGRPFQLAYIVRAISPGTFHHPAASVEDMYRPEFRARTAAGEVTIGE